LRIGERKRLRFKDGTARIGSSQRKKKGDGDLDRSGFRRSRGFDTRSVDDSTTTMKGNNGARSGIILFYFYYEASYKNEEIICPLLSENRTISNHRQLATIS
jgi:hypothetical protein